MTILLFIMFGINLNFTFDINNTETVYMNNNNDNNMPLETITLGAGCFWCVEAVFDRLEGVESVTSGYSGGNISNPTYREVTSGRTGHAEVIQVRYNPEIIPFSRLLEVFFMTHDPTTLNRQGADVGTQYRSAIFYHTEEQKRTAQEVKNMLEKEKIWSDPIVTEITEYENFYRAEDYHQEYYLNNPNQGYCRMVIAPKIEKFEKLFKDFIRDN
ncbi:MAG: peptide-methionine (S)-S-oxide reductase MsrA [bacterium]